MFHDWTQIERHTISVEVEPRSQAPPFASDSVDHAPIFTCASIEADKISRYGRFMGEQRHANRLWNLLVNVLASSAFLRGGLREQLYIRGGIDPNDTQIRPGVWFFSSKITFGSGGMINGGCYFENREQVTIGARCFLGPQVMIGTSTHAIGEHDQRAGGYIGGPVSIGDGCWIGARATILPGVTIAPGCIVAAGAVVAADTEPDGLYAGIPATRKREL